MACLGLMYHSVEGNKINWMSLFNVLFYSLVKVLQLQESKIISQIIIRSLSFQKQSAPSDALGLQLIPERHPNVILPPSWQHVCLSQFVS